jgi:putative oxidoreductase
MEKESSGKWIGLTPYMQSVLRIVPAFMFMLTGTMILFDFPQKMGNGAPVQLMSQMGVGGILEFVGGFLLLIGLFTRCVAFVLAGEMAVAYFQFHAPDGLWPMANGGTGAVLYCFIFLYFSFAGGGKWSVDAWLKNKKLKSNIS